MQDPAGPVQQDGRLPYHLVGVGKASGSGALKKWLKGIGGDATLIRSVTGFTTGFCQVTPVRHLSGHGTPLSVGRPLNAGLLWVWTVTHPAPVGCACSHTDDAQRDSPAKVHHGRRRMQEMGSATGITVAKKKGPPGGDP